MKVDVIEATPNTYEVKNIEYCCNDMKTAHSNNIIGFGNNGEYSRRNNPNINVYEVWCTDGELYYEPQKINYCPFCGKTITVTIRKMTKEDLLIDEIESVERKVSDASSNIRYYKDLEERASKKLPELEGQLARLKAELAEVMKAGEKED